MGTAVELSSEDGMQIEALKDLMEMFTMLEYEVRSFIGSQDRPNPVTHPWVQRASGLRQVIFSPLW